MEELSIDSIHLINPTKVQSVKDALEFCSSRKVADISTEEFMKLVNNLNNFYNVRDQQSNSIR